MKTFTILFTLFSTLNLQSQTMPYEVEIAAKYYGSDIEYGIHIVRKENSAHIIYSNKEFDDLRYSKKDSLRIRKLLNLEDKKNKDNREIFEIMDKYKRFTKDSLEISLNEKVLFYANSVIKSKAEIFKEVEKNKNRIIIDGSRFKVGIHNGTNSFDYIASTPDEQHFPLIHHLVKEALFLYFEKAKNPILPTSLDQD